MEILLVLLLLAVALWAFAFFFGRWQLQRNTRRYEVEVTAEPEAVLAIAAKALKGRNPLAVVSVEGTAAERSIEKRTSVGPMKGLGCQATARVECTPAEVTGRTKVVAVNTYTADTLAGVPANANAVAVGRRAIERAMKALNGQFDVSDLMDGDAPPLT